MHAASDKAFSISPPHESTRLVIDAAKYLSRFVDTLQSRPASRVQTCACAKKRKALISMTSERPRADGVAIARYKTANEVSACNVYVCCVHKDARAHVLRSLAALQPVILITYRVSLIIRSRFCTSVRRLQNARKHKLLSFKMMRSKAQTLIKIVSKMSLLLNSSWPICLTSKSVRKLT